MAIVGLKTLFSCKTFLGGFKQQWDPRCRKKKTFEIISVNEKI
jgi:hypothetical protein